MKTWHLVILALALGILAYIAYAIYKTQQEGKKTVTVRGEKVTITPKEQLTGVLVDTQEKKETIAETFYSTTTTGTTPLPTPQYTTNISEWTPIIGSPYGRTMTPTVTQSQVAGYATSVTISPYNIPTLKGVLAK
jgi:hypothetical protein